MHSLSIVTSDKLRSSNTVAASELLQTTNTGSHGLILTDHKVFFIIIILYYYYFIRHTYTGGLLTHELTHRVLCFGTRTVFANVR